VKDLNELALAKKLLAVDDARARNATDAALAERVPPRLLPSDTMMASVTPSRGGATRDPPHLARRGVPFSVVPLRSSDMTREGDARS
jgi:hypothetical protein